MDKKGFENKISKVKGEVIIHMSIIDLRLSLVIANYVTKGKEKIDIVMFLCNKTNIKFRVDVLKKIIKENEDMRLLSYPKLADDIKDLNNKRNLLAHSMPDVPNKKDYKGVKHINFINSSTLGKYKDFYDLRLFKTHIEKSKRASATLKKMSLHLESK